MMRPRTTHWLAQLPRRPKQCLYRSFSSDGTIQENDTLLVRQWGNKQPKWRLSAPIRLDATNPIKLHYGATIKAEDVIGKKLLDKVVDSSGRDCTLHEASLGTYILESERTATPIYPHDAATIVGMMDLHPTRPGETDSQEEPFEVFEAGTGMGSLTLHIARAIHAANPGLSPSLRRALVNSPPKRFATDEDAVTTITSPLDTLRPWNRMQFEEGEEAQMKDYWAKRRAVLHSLDNRRAHTLKAERLVRRFRKGQYLTDVDFHVGTIEAFAAERLSTNGNKPFLSRAVLDLPSPAAEAAHLLPCLHPSATLIVFQPSISQIAAFDDWAPSHLRLDRVVELPPVSVRGGGSDPGFSDGGGGRMWDVRWTGARRTGESVQVMRPRVGDMLAGGGFVGVWRVWPEKVAEDVEKVEEKVVEDAGQVEEAREDQGIRDEVVSEEVVSEQVMSDEVVSDEDSGIDVEERREV